MALRTEYDIKDIKEYVQLKIDMLRLPFGKERRDVILKSLSKCNMLFVNCKYHPQIKKDNDLKYLIKKGKIKLYNCDNKQVVKLS